jgi:hypothetical protein
VRIVWVALGRKDAPGKPPGRHATFVGGLSAEEEATSQQRNAVDEFFTQEKRKPGVNICGIAATTRT